MTALEKSTRRKLFYGMVALFAVIAPLTLLYSRGYSIDFQDWGLAATGGVFVKTVQPGAKIFVGDELYKETSFISHGALISNLIPRRYTIRVEKEGFRSWQKLIQVPEQEVVEFRRVFLPPATVTPAVVFRSPATALRRVYELRGQPEIAIEVGEPSQPSTVLIVDGESGETRLTLARVSRWFWDAESHSFIVGRAQAGGRMRWYRTPFGAGSPGGETRLTFRGLPSSFTADSVWPHPANENEFYFFAGGSLFLQGLSSVPVPIAEQIHSYAVANDHIYFVSRNGFFVESDLDGQNVQILGRKGLFLDDRDPAKIISSPAGDILVMDSAGGLFIYQPGRDQELDTVIGNIRGVDFSTEGDRALLWDEHRVLVFWLRDNPDQPFDLARSRRQIFTTEEPIEQAFLNAAGTHVFLLAGNAITMTEVDDRGGANSYTLVADAARGLAMERSDPRLYWLEGARVLRATLK